MSWIRLMKLDINLSSKMNWPNVTQFNVWYYFVWYENWHPTKVQYNRPDCSSVYIYYYVLYRSFISLITNCVQGKNGFFSFFSFRSETNEPKCQYTRECRKHLAFSVQNSAFSEWELYYYFYCRRLFCWYMYICIFNIQARVIFGHDA